MTRYLALTAAALLMTACASDGGDKMDSMPATAESAQAAIADAKAALEQADKTGAAWRDTGKMIKEAEKLAKEQKYEEAMKMAEKAEHQSANAMAQQESQANAADRL